MSEKNVSRYGRIFNPQAADFFGVVTACFARKA
jgi:hypothetical protein